MFSNSDIDYFIQNTTQFVIYQLNCHDVTIHSTVTGHDWIIVSSYGATNCYILHRHSKRDPFHRQKGNYKSLNDALEYIDNHEDWFATHKIKSKISME